jgi:hypothetical protein
MRFSMINMGVFLSLIVSFHMELFHIERGFYSRTEIGEERWKGKLHIHECS